MDNALSIRLTIDGYKIIVHGKWLVIKNVDRIDETWSTIVQAILRDDLGGCIEAKCSTQYYNPTAHGPGPTYTSQISVYTSEENKMDVGEKLIHLVQHDIWYKLEEDTQSSRYRHKNPDMDIERFYYNNGHPSTALEGNKCIGYIKDREHASHLNTVKCQKLQEEKFGYWKLKFEENDALTNYWHYLKDRILAEQRLGIIEMICPHKKHKDKPTFQVFTSQAHMLATGLTLIHIMEKDIEFEELESGNITKVIWKSTT